MAEQQEEKMLVDKLRPTAEMKVAAVDVKAEEKVLLADLVCEMLKEEGVEYVFTLTAGSTWSILPFLQKNRIKVVNCRHEQAAGFAMDAWGRLTRRPGVALPGGGTGLTNFSSGLCQAYAAGSPGVAIQAESGPFDDDKFGGQGIARAENQLVGISKWVRKVNIPETFLWQLKRAFRSAVTPPVGPVVMAYGSTAITPGLSVSRRVAYQAYTPGYWKPQTCNTQGDPALVEKAVKWLLEAEKPVIIAGHAAHQDDCQDELRELAHLLGVPSSGRRIARGMISEEDSLNYGRRARGPVFDQADRCIVLGLRIGFLEAYGQAPFFPHHIRYCQIQADRDTVETALPTDIEIIGNLKEILKQMIQVVKDMGIKKPLDKWEKWRQFIVDTEASYKSRTLARTDRMMKQMPLHPDLFGRLAAEVLNDDYNNDYITIIDGYTASAYFTGWNVAVNSGTVLDAAETIGIGHSFGMALAAGLATNREKPVIALVGDGAVGAGGFDAETCARWNIPVVFLHENNNTLVNGVWEDFWSKACAVENNILHDSWETLPHIRYEKMFAEIGCHAEFVERPEEVKPAVKRAIEIAIKEKQPAFVEAFVDTEVVHSSMAQPAALARTSLYFRWDELPDKGKKLVATQLASPAAMTRLPKDWQDGIASYQKK